MTSEELLAEVRARLAELADPQFREGVVRFFKEPVDPYGVRAPEVRRVAAGAAREVKTWPLARRNHFCRELWRSGKIEEGGIAIEVYRRFRKQCTSREFHLFEKWIDRYVRNWAHTDGVSSWLLAACIGNEPELIKLLPRWTTSRNRWKRRAAAVSLLQEAKKGRNTEAIFDLAERLIEDGDDLVQKGVGWLLKETYPKKPRETIRFLLGIGKRAPRLVLRIAAEKMNPADRKKILNRRAAENAEDL